ncbi:MAG: hypothetical protein ACFFCP_17170 [Promethearchaeota archaeon]
MRYINRGVEIIIKIVFVLLIPYYFVMISDSSAPIRMQTTYLISGIIGYWSIPGIVYSFPQQVVFWQQNQLLFSILFILPMILFALYLGEKQTDNKSIVTGIGAILVSYLSMYLTTPNFITGTFAPLDYLSLPNVVSLSMFVFVFWPLLKNSLPPRETIGTNNERKRVLARLRETLGKWFPRNAATLTWTCLVIFPTFLFLSVYIPSETETQLGVTLSGGLYVLVYSYTAFSGYRHITMSFETAAWASFFILAMWIINLLVGIITIQYLRGKSTKRLLNRAVGVVFLILMVPIFLLGIFVNLFGATGYYPIPLPIYLVAIVLVAKYIHLPAEPSDEMIKVPLRVRISSFFHRTGHDEQMTDVKPTDDIEDSDSSG